MKLSVKNILLIMTMMTASLASGKESIGKPTAIVVQQQIATLSAPARVKHKRIVKSKVHRAVPFGMDDNTDDFESCIDLQVAYRRPELVKIKCYLLDDDELPNHITDRLAQIRALAMEKYREVHS